MHAPTIAHHTEAPPLSARLSARRPLLVGLLIAAGYLACMWLSQAYLSHPGSLFPAPAIALAGLFLEGIGYWPVIYLCALIGDALIGVPLIFLILMPIAQALQAALGAYALRRMRLDPLFRRTRDALLILAVALLVGLIVPTAGSLGYYLGGGAGLPVGITTWGVRYVGNLFCLLIGVPFLLRWFSKSRFHRTWLETIETVGVFLFLIVVTVLIFLANVTSLGGISLIYVLLIPLFWIALRLRPRFVTLALVIISFIAIAGLYIGNGVPTPELFYTRLYAIEAFMIVLATIFIVMTAIEEDRRVNANLLRQQVAGLENAMARIQSESEAKNDFISMLGHELRNPLAPVVTAIDLLQLEPDMARHQEALAMMENRLQAVRRILDDLLNISRIVEGKISLRRAPMDLEVTLRRAALSTEHYLKERHQSLAFDPLPSPVHLHGDPVRIEQIFSNLLTNASKYSGTGSRIGLSVRRDGGMVEVVVSDEGRGIAPEHIEAIFTPFFQVSHQGRAKSGLGIGLALVKSLVQMHGGTIAVASEVGRGSRFIVRLPALAATETLPPSIVQSPSMPATHSEPVLEPAQEPESAAPGHGTLGLSVLVVDDNDAAASGLGRLLELKGIRVRYAYDGRQALEAVAAQSPDAILLDVGLPDQDGYSVAKKLRERGYQGRLIALTGYGTEDARASAQGAGFDHFLVKPAGFADLRRVIPELG